jgi:hypothetical protein
MSITISQKETPAGLLVSDGQLQINDGVNVSVHALIRKSPAARRLQKHWKDGDGYHPDLNCR